MATNNQNLQNDDQQDLKKHGVQDIIPQDEEYYTLDLKRGDDTDVNDLPQTDIAGNDPLNENDDEVVEYAPDVQPQTSNAGGTVHEKDSINQNKSSGAVAGEPGHWGVDEDTD